MTWSDIPEFGARLPDRDYSVRPGSYAIIFDRERRRIAVVHTPEGCFLPGGGRETGETPEESLRREVAEECALALSEVRVLGMAVEHVHTRDEHCFSKEGVFFIAAVGEQLAGPPEQDHALAWLTPEEALTALTHESQRWVVQRAALGRS